MSFLHLAQVVTQQPPDDIMTLIHDALANHGWVVAGIAAVVLIVPMILRAFKINVPFLDTVLGVLLQLLREVERKQEADKKAREAETAAKAVPPQGVAAVADVVPIDALVKKDKKDAKI